MKAFGGLEVAMRGVVCAAILHYSNPIHTENTFSKFIAWFHEGKSHSYVKCWIAKQYYGSSVLVRCLSDWMNFDVFRIIRAPELWSLILFIFHSNTPSVPGRPSLHVGYSIFDEFRIFFNCEWLQSSHCTYETFPVEKQFHLLLSHHQTYAIQFVCFILVLSIRTLDINHLHEV